MPRAHEGQDRDRDGGNAVHLRRGAAELPLAALYGIGVAVILGPDWTPVPVLAVPLTFIVAFVFSAGVFFVIRAAARSPAAVVPACAMGLVCAFAASLSVVSPISMAALQAVSLCVTAIVVVVLWRASATLPGRLRGSVRWCVSTFLLVLGYLATDSLMVHSGRAAPSRLPDRQLLSNLVSNDMQLRSEAAHYLASERPKLMAEAALDERTKSTTVRFIHTLKAHAVHRTLEDVRDTAVNPERRERAAAVLLELDRLRDTEQRP